MTTIDFPTMRPKRPKIKTAGDGLAELAMPENSRSVCLQTIGGAYELLKRLHGGDADEARRRIIAWLDVIDNPRECHE